MPNCGFCGKPQQSGAKSRKIVVETRLIITGIFQEEDPKTGLVRVYSKGRVETVKEKSACPVCAGQPHFAQTVEFRDESQPVLSEAKT
ncbi:MAG: hypothetical protein A2896_00100 [Candidatus Nealsonbacteria bacterium RIFCSPLOWO2_01_FULL_43_32]|uniref:Uncharacterized protein n=1 Tax=Candidatus Nealsonbacteria bacterium RIFCSPLOWO2_01_FULL_43_32 TaxID=1801672 RepID=A0A1G2EG90_9BACT|nr:MAG: hypothetical protein A2896_00100 [Candidatus Nealsonbacteria bacterium RIFCSPLOWO2_01_FULL_43_32]